jgi:hypothetical protein
MKLPVRILTDSVAINLRERSVVFYLMYLRIKSSKRMIYTINFLNLESIRIIDVGLKTDESASPMTKRYIKPCFVRLS